LRFWEDEVRQTRAATLVLALLFAAVAGLAAEKGKQPPATPVDLNSATVDQLEQLPGIGASTAAAILKFREKSGAFQRVEDLLAIRGISKNKFEKLRPYVTVSGPAKQKR